MYKFIYLLCLFFFFNSYLFADEIRTVLRKNKIDLNESFSISFITNKKIQERPDFSPFEEDFDILSTNSGFNASIINNTVKEEASWTLILMPKREGHLLIPSIKFGSDYSNQKIIEVVSSDFKPRDEAIFIETSLSPEKNIYQDTALSFRVRLYSALQIIQGTLSEPKVNDSYAFIERLGQDNQYESFHQNGMKYTVIERNYVIVPSKPGDLDISPIVFEGSIIKGGGHSFFNSHADFKRAFSKSEKIQVLPPPTQLSNPWFTANDVSIFENGLLDLSQMKLGDPVTWTLTIKADGALGNQIPDPVLEIPKGIKYYIDKSEITNELNDDHFTGIKQIKVALIPMQAGEFVLPEFSLQWWNLKTNEMQETKLSAKKIHVMAEEIAMNEVTIPVIGENKSAPLKESGSEPIQNDSSLKNSLVITLFSLIILLALYLRSFFTKSDSLKKMKSELKKACIKNDAKRAEECFLLLADELFKGVKPLNLMTIKPHLPKNLQEALYQLYEVLYGKKADWEGKKFWKAFSSFKPLKEKSKKDKMSPLYPLYPKEKQED